MLFKSHFEKKRFAKVNQAWMDKAIEAVSLIMTIGPLMSLIINGCIIAILWFGGHKILNGTMISSAKVSSPFTELCTALPIWIKVSIGIPNALP